MAFQNIAGRAGFVLELDKSQLDRGLPTAEREFSAATASMARSADRAGGAIGEVGGAGLAGRLGGMGALLGRAGLYGIGISTAISLNRELRSSLEVTGSEAFTTEGKIRNMASAFLSGDIIGGLLHWRDAPKTVEDLGISAQQASGRLDALKKVAFGQAEALREQAEALGEQRGKADEAKAAFEQYSAVVKEAGTSNQQLAAQLLEQGRAWQELSGQMRAAFNQAQTFRGRQGEVIFQGGFAGLRPQPPTGPGPTTFGIPIQTPTSIGPSARTQARLTIAQANQDLDEVLRLQTLQRDRLRQAVESSHGNVQQREKLNLQLAAATAAVIQTQRQIEAQDKAEADAAQSAQEAAANDRARRLRAGLAAREQNLQNQYQAALLTPGQRDDQRRFGTLANFLTGLGRDQRLDPRERADARGRLIALRRQRVNDAKQETDDELATQEAILRNNLKAAELTEKNKADDIRALRKLRGFYERAEGDSTGLERQAFRSDRLDTQKKLNAILSGADADAISLADIRRMQVGFLQSLQGITNRFGGNLSPDGAQTATNTWQTSRLMAQQNTMLDRLTRGVQHPGAKYARLALMEPYGSVGGV